MSENNNPVPPRGNNPGPKGPSPALFIWLLVFAGLIGLFVLRSSSLLSSPQEWSQSQFEAQLAAGNIVTASLMPESDNVYSIEGKYRIPVQQNTPDAPKDLRVSPKNPEQNEPVYSTRVVMTDTLMQKLNSAHATAK